MAQTPKQSEAALKTLLANKDHVLKQQARRLETTKNRYQQEKEKAGVYKKKYETALLRIKQMEARLKYQNVSGRLKSDSPHGGGFSPTLHPYEPPNGLDEVPQLPLLECLPEMDPILNSPRISDERATLRNGIYSSNLESNYFPSPTPRLTIDAGLHLQAPTYVKARSNSVPEINVGNISPQTSPTQRTRGRSRSQTDAHDTDATDIPVIDSRLLQHARAFRTPRKSSLSSVNSLASIGTLDGVQFKMKKRFSSIVGDGSGRVQKLWKSVRDSLNFSEYFQTGLLSDSLSEESFVGVMNKIVIPEQRDKMFSLVFRVISQYRSLLSVANSISMELNTEKALTKIFDGTNKILGAGHVSMYVVKNDFLECRVGVGVGKHTPLGQGIIGYVGDSGESINLKYAYKDPRYVAEIDNVDDNQTQTILCVPIIDSGKVIAVIAALNKIDGFSSIDEHLIESISALSGHVLTKTQMYEDQVLVNERSQALLEVVKAVASNDDLEQIIDSIIKVSYKVLSCDRVTLFMVDTMTNELWCKVSKDAQGFRIPIGLGIAGHVAASGDIVNIPDAYQDERFNPEIDRITRYHTRTVLCVPIRNHDRIVGVIQCINKICPYCRECPCFQHPVAFDEQDVQVLDAFAGETASALQKKHFESAFRFLMEEQQDRDVRDYVEQFMAEKRHSRSASIDSTLSSSMETSSLAGDYLSIPHRRSSSMADYFYPQETAKFDYTSHFRMTVDIEKFMRWDFDYWYVWEDSQKQDELLGFILHIFQEFNLLNQFHIPIKKMRNFILTIRDGYFANPYHNFLHGFSVTHVTYLLYNKTALGSHLSSTNILATFLAAICHDLGHPGQDNKYQINSQSDLALRYNDQAVLENFHAFRAFEVMRNPECDILQHLKSKKRQTIRKLTISAILHTDMTKHEGLVNQLKEVSDSDEGVEGKLSDHQFFVDVAVHAADLANPILPFFMYHKWASSVVEEFYCQAQREIREGLEFAPFMQKKDPLSLAKLQVNFITYVVAPLWYTLRDVFPELAEPIQNMENNKKHFEDYIKAEEERGNELAKEPEVPHKILIQTPSSWKNDDRKEAVSPNSPITPFSPKAETPTFNVNSESGYADEPDFNLNNVPVYEDT